MQFSRIAKSVAASQSRQVLIAGAVMALFASGATPANAITLFAQTDLGEGTLAQLQAGTAVFGTSAQSPTFATTSDSGTLAGITGSASATSQLGPGGVTFHTYANLSATSQSLAPNISALSAALAGFTDTIVVSSSTQMGAGLLQFNLAYNGIFSASVSAGYNDSYIYGVVCQASTTALCPPSTPASNVTLLASQFSPATGSQIVSGYAKIGELGFTYNVPFDVTVYAVINADYTSAGAGSSLNVLSDFSDTASLGPIDIFNSNGELDVKSSITSQTTGQTYATAVPEPETWAMLLVGFIGLGSGIRRNRTNVAARLRVS